MVPESRLPYNQIGLGGRHQDGRYGGKWVIGHRVAGASKPWGSKTAIYLGESGLHVQTRRALWSVKRPFADRAAGWTGDQI